MAKGMLTLVGLGIWDEKDLSLRGMEAAIKADVIYAEFYTADWGGSIENLEKIIGKKINILERSGMEEKSSAIINEAKTRNIVVMVPGDPLVATTHIHIILDAKKQKIPTEIIHASSVYTTIAECGLGIYGFGRTSTVVKPQKGYEPSSFYDVIGTNKKNGLHSMLLLDIGMSLKEGLDTLINIEAKEKKNLITPDTEIIAASKLGSNNQKIIFGKVKGMKNKDLKQPAVIIIPGNLHFLEKEFLKTLN
jgi:diphthine synthase